MAFGRSPIIENGKETLKVVAHTQFPGSIKNHTGNNKQGKVERGTYPYFSRME